MSFLRSQHYQKKVLKKRLNLTSVSYTHLVYLGCPVTPIIDIHKDNIEYEKLHPPVIYSKEKKKSVRTKKVKEEKVTKAKPKKGTVYLTKLSSNKTLTLSREAAEGIVRDYPNEYKITEIE